MSEDPIPQGQPEQQNYKTQFYWLLGFMAAGTLPFISWMLWNQYSMDARVSRVETKWEVVQLQIEQIERHQADVIPPIVEGSLKEIRDRLNSIRDSVEENNRSNDRNSQELQHIKEKIDSMGKSP